LRQTTLETVFGAAVDANGTLYAADYSNLRVRKWFKSHLSSAVQHNTVIKIGVH
jgi:hypothetical protein